jgi:hypothetical protein
MGMKTAIDSEHRFIYLGSAKGLSGGPLPPHVSICHDRLELEAAMSHQPTHVTWISSSRGFTDILLEQAVGRATLRGFRGSHLITLKPPRSESIAALLGLFHPVFGLIEGFQWLPKEELVEAISRDDAGDRFIGGSVDPKAKTLTLLRGDITPVVVPFSLFPKSGDGTAPDFTKLGLTDYGRTIVLGEYAAAADAILYELDPDYRRRLKKQRRRNERTFGAAMMRLRKQRRLKRTDFAPISSKEVARIERNEVATPHLKTLEIIADRLGVRPDEISDY